VHPTHAHFSFRGCATYSSLSFARSRSILGESGICCGFLFTYRSPHYVSYSFPFSRSGFRLLPLLPAGFLHTVFSFGIASGVSPPIYLIRPRVHTPSLPPVGQRRQALLVCSSILFLHYQLLFPSDNCCFADSVSIRDSLFPSTPRPSFSSSSDLCPLGFSLCCGSPLPVQ